MNSRRDLRSLNQGAFSASWRSSTCGQKKGGSQPTSVRLDWLMGLLRLESPPFGFVVGHSNHFQHLQCDLKSGCCLWITLFVAHKQVHTRNILYYHHLRSSIIWYTVYSNYILSWCNVQYSMIQYDNTVHWLQHLISSISLTSWFRKIPRHWEKWSSEFQPQVFSQETNKNSISGEMTCCSQSRTFEFHRRTTSFLLRPQQPPAPEREASWKISEKATVVVLLYTHWTYLLTEIKIVSSFRPCQAAFEG